LFDCFEDFGDAAGFWGGGCEGGVVGGMTGRPTKVNEGDIVECVLDEFVLRVLEALFVALLKNDRIYSVVVMLLV
jgi:hypothetical protein